MVRFILNDSFKLITFQVGLRIRPMNEDEIIAGATPVAHKVDDNVSILCRIML